MRRCPQCDTAVEGRVNKVFCDSYCRTTFHFKKNRFKEESLFSRIDKQLKLNRRLLKLFNKGGKSTVSETKLFEAGFDPKYFTHYWKNDKNAVYLFCYDVGFLSLREQGKAKYLLIDWQDYMSPGGKGRKQNRVI
jgi:hypothetical protein